jgi:hypothetical protein
VSEGGGSGQRQEGGAAAVDVAGDGKELAVIVFGFNDGVLLC